MSFVIRHMAGDVYFISLSEGWAEIQSNAKQFSTHEEATTVITQLAIHSGLAHPEDLVVREVDMFENPSINDTSWWKRVLGA